MFVPGLNTTLIESRPSPGRLRDDVEHVVDAVDLLLDRRRDGLGDDLRGRSRVGGRDIDGRRGDLGILGDRAAHFAQWRR